jgi:hypothetical protein
MPASAVRTTSSGSMRSPAFHAEGATEPSNASRAEIGSRLIESLPYVQQSNFQSVTALVRAVPQPGGAGVSLEIAVSVQPIGGGHVPLPVTPALQGSLIALWHRCRERNGTPYRALRAHLEGGATTIDLEL